MKQPWLLPVVAETYDGFLNDINGFHVKEEHVVTALNGASSGPVAEGNVGGGTGMGLYGFKGGNGTASRRLTDEDGAYTVGVFVQANFGERGDLVGRGRSGWARGCRPAPNLWAVRSKTYTFRIWFGDRGRRNRRAAVAASARAARPPRADGPRPHPAASLKTAAVNSSSPFRQLL